GGNAPPGGARDAAAAARGRGARRAGLRRAEPRRARARPRQRARRSRRGGTRGCVRPRARGRRRAGRAAAARRGVPPARCAGRQRRPGARAGAAARPDHPRPRRPRRAALMRPPTTVWKFAASSLAILVLIAAAGVFILDRIAEDDAVGNAREIAALAAHGAVEPNLTEDVLQGDPAALARLDKIVKTRVLRGSAVRVKLWSQDA